MSKGSLRDAPGCLGSVVLRVRRAKPHPICTTCPYRTVCARIAKVNAERLNEILGVEAAEHALVMPTSVSVTAKRPGTGGLSVKGAKAVEALSRIGVTTDVVRRMVPRADFIERSAHWTPNYIRWGLDHLWRQGGRLTRVQLAKEFQRQFACSEQTAASRVSIFLDVTTHLDVVRTSNGWMEWVNG